MTDREYEEPAAAQQALNGPTVEETFLLGMKAHKAGRLQDAEQHYRDILQKQPKHSAASHLLGELTAQLGNYDAALPLLKAALVAAPGTRQNWIAYIRVLIEAGQIENATRVLEKGNQLGLKGDDVAALATKLAALGEGKFPPSSDMAALMQAFRARNHVEVKRQALAMTQSYPNTGIGWKTLALSLKHEGSVAEAVAAMQRAISVAPGDPRDHNLFGTWLQQTGRLAEAASSYSTAVELKPDYIEAHFGLGTVLQSLGRLDEARASYRRAVDFKPDSVAAELDLGHAFFALGRIDEAADAYRKVAALKPDHDEAHGCLGLALSRVGRFHDAEASCRRALELSPERATVHNNLGNVLRDSGRLVQAEESFRRAIALKPDFAEAHCNLGSVLTDLHRLSAAETSYRRAAELNPKLADAHGNLGHVLRDMCRMEEAASSFRKAALLEPTSLKHAFDEGLMLPAIYESTSEIDHWRARYHRNLDALTHGPRFDEPSELALSLTHFYLAYHNKDDRQLKQQASRLFRSRIPCLNFVAPHVHSWRKPTHRPVRVGFCSEYLFGHTIGKLYQGLIRHLDPAQFEVRLYSSSRARRDKLSVVLEKAAVATKRLLPRFSEQHRLIAEDELDVMVFPEVGMAPGTYFLAHARLAPVQVVGWGHPDTTGIDTLDYFVSSSRIEPADADSHYTERLVKLGRLPCFYEPILGSESNLSRSRFGLSEASTLYGCPQTLFKLHPDFDAVLAEIVARDPAACIVLIEDSNPMAAGLLKARWEKTFPGLSEHVVFLPHQPLPRFLALLSQLDVLLDPIHFGSGNSMYEAMLDGTPIVTWPGTFMRGRIVAGAYQQIGLHGAPVASAPEEYAALAAMLGRDTDRRRHLRQELAQSARRELFSDMQAVREFEEFLVAAVTAADMGQKLPAGWSLVGSHSGNQ